MDTQSGCLAVDTLSPATLIVCKMCSALSDCRRTNDWMAWYKLSLLSRPIDPHDFTMSQVGSATNASLLNVTSSWLMDLM